MTPPLSPEAVAQMVADREAGTPGRWRFQIETDQDGYDEGVSVTADIVTVHWSNLGFGADEDDTRVDDIIKANARRIARLPDLEAAYLTLAAENATLRAERDSYEASSVEAHRVSRAHQSDAILWQYSAAVGDVPPLLVTIWKQRKAAEAELATLRASEAAAKGAVTEPLARKRAILAAADASALAARPAPQPAADTRVVTVSGIDTQVMSAAADLDAKGKGNPAWAFIDYDANAMSFGRWAKCGPNPAPYIRADLVISAIIGTATPAPSDKIAEAAEDAGNLK